MNKDKRDASILTYAGTLPFIILTLLSLFGIERIVFLPVDLALFLYAPIILSFIAGIHWGIYMHNKDIKLNLFITSNIVALIAWFALLLPNIFLSIGVYILCFLVLIAVDAHLNKQYYLYKWFYRLRLHATLIVVLCLSAYLIINL